MTLRSGHFRAGLSDLGYIEGRNIELVYRSAGAQPDRLAAVAAELARLPVDLIVAHGTPATYAAKQSTTTIPIVMIGIGDPIRAGLVPGLAHPSGNVTGNTILGPEMSAKRIQLIKEILPVISRMAFLWNPDNASHAAYVEEWKTVAPSLGVKMIFVEARSVSDFDSAFAMMMREQPDAFTMTADPMHQLSVGRVIEFLAANRLPGIYQLRENVAGGLMSYGASLPDLFRRGAAYVQKILQGTKPADLPVELPTKFDLTINLRTAKLLGLTIPESFLLRCDEVIE